MKDLNKLNKYRQSKVERALYGRNGNEANGVFMIPCLANKRRAILIKCIASNGQHWEHVSASLSHRCPTWEEMEYIKRVFFEPHEVVMQLHVKETNHISKHPYCLHLWRPEDGFIPIPPIYMV